MYSGKMVEVFLTPFWFGAGQFLTKRFLSFVPMDFRLSLLEVALADKLPVSLYSWMVS